MLASVPSYNWDINNCKAVILSILQSFNVSNNQIVQELPWLQISNIILLIYCGTGGWFLIKIGIAFNANDPDRFTTSGIVPPKLPKEEFIPPSLSARNNWGINFLIVVATTIHKSPPSRAVAIWHTLGKNECIRASNNDVPSSLTLNGATGCCSFKAKWIPSTSTL